MDQREDDSSRFRSLKWALNVFIPSGIRLLAVEEPLGCIESFYPPAGRRYRVLCRRPDHPHTSKGGFRTKRDAELFLARVEVEMKSSPGTLLPAASDGTLARRGFLR